MGDGGSQFLGFILAVFPLCNTNTSYESYKLLIVALISMIPLLDVVAAMWRRIRDHYSLFSSDKAHLHHKLMNLGFKPWPILVVLFGLQILLCLIAIFSQQIEGTAGYIIMGIGYVVIIAFFCIIHYTNRAVLLKHSNDGKSEEDDES